MKNIEFNHGHWRLKDALRKLLLECRAKSSTRYAINGVHVGENALAATDGRRLVEIECPHQIPPGNYFMTSDGYLLDFVDGNFPNYQDIIPEPNEIRKIVKTSGNGKDVIGLILGELCHAGYICRLDLFHQPIEILSRIIDGVATVSVYRENPKEHPFIIKAETTLGHLRYIQMPVNVKNEVQS